MLTWELLGALVGAGFASGREIAAFFAKYGMWGYVGAVLAATVLVWLADSKLPSAWMQKWPEHLWRVLLAALLTAAGGAMLSGAGEIAALVIPLHGAYWWGVGGTLLIAWLLANRTSTGLAWVSRGMIIVFSGVLVISLTMRGGLALRVQDANPLEALSKGLCYGGFNAALMIPVLQHVSQPQKYRRRALRFAGGIVLLLLLAGIAALQRHPQLLDVPMPFVQMLKSWGKAGYYLSAACLYLAVLSTLTACIRGLGQGSLPLFGILAVSFLGFSQVVDTAYTILGGACMILLLAAKFRNCCRKAFISGEDML